MLLPHGQRVASGPEQSHHRVCRCSKGESLTSTVVSCSHFRCTLEPLGAPPPPAPWYAVQGWGRGKDGVGTMLGRSLLSSCASVAACLNLYDVSPLHAKYATSACNLQVLHRFATQMLQHISTQPCNAQKWVSCLFVTQLYAKPYPGNQADSKHDSIPFVTTPASLKLSSRR